jgi:hypothetical protein
MPIEPTGQLAKQLQELINSSGNALDTNNIVSVLNGFLPAQSRVTTVDTGMTDGVYKRLGPNDMVLGKNEVVTTGLWTGNTGSLTTCFTSSAQDTGGTSGRYYVDAYNVVTSSTSAEIQFSVAYGHVSGAGAPSLAQSDSSVLSTKATYSQYKNLLLDPTDTKFTVVTGSAAGTTDIDDIFVINVARGRYKEKIDPGNWSLTLTSGSTSITLIDDSGKKLTDTVGKAGRIFNISSGSLQLGQISSSVYATSASNGQGFGLFYPDAGVFVLNPAALSSSIGNGLTPNKSLTAYQYNHRLLFNAIRDGADFQARSTENISTNHYFVRLNNREFNFSNNPTFITGSVGKFRNPTFEGDPKVFPTTVGLYNDAHELLAVAKLSQPTRKAFDREMNIKIKLEF